LRQHMRSEGEYAGVTSDGARREEAVSC